MVTTLPGLLLNTLSLYPKPQFMLVKKMGHYTPISSAEFGETVRHYALGLQALGQSIGHGLLDLFGRHVVNLRCRAGDAARHRRLEAEGEIERRLIGLLDGTRDLSGLARELAPVLNQPEDIAAAQIEANLAKLAKMGLLEA